MESDAENVTEIDTYSFLLGSAIRNEDTDQFLSIYDSIIPAGLEEIQVEAIKQKAREIAELSEDKYSALVRKARDYSLAQNRSTMSQRDNHRSELKYTRPHVCCHDGNSDGQGRKSESCFRPDVIIDMPSCQDEEKRQDNDSGIYNSSKATTSLGSNSEQEESEGEERAASFDYFPSGPKIPPQMFHTDYDEAFDVDSEKGSNVESPRSDKSANKDSDQDYYPETEMTTFRNYSRECDDFETDEDSDEDKCTPRYMYGQRRSGNYYTPMTQESSEDYGDMSSSTFSFDNSRRALKDKSASSLRGVDDSIHFPLSSPTPSRYSSYSRYNNSSSTGTRVEKSMYSRHDMDDDVFTTGAKDPPFGHGRDQVDKVGKSICSLLSNSASTVDDMPEGRPIAQSLDLADDGRRRKKKKKGSKDDLDDKTRRNADHYDENGNPVDRYLQMRRSPNFTSGSIQRKNLAGFPATLRDFAPYSIAQTPISELESPHYQNQELSKKPRRKQKQEVVKKAEEIENYVGNKEIDELLDFIESDKNGRKPKKNSQISNDVSLVTKSNEKNKKNKEKKLKSVNEEKCDVKESKEEVTESKNIDETTPLINSHKAEFPDYKTQSVQNHVDPHLKNSINRMGNTAIKDIPDEKEDIRDEKKEVISVENKDFVGDNKMAHETEKMDASSESVMKANKKEKKSNPKSVEKQNLTKVKGKGSSNPNIEIGMVNGDTELTGEKTANSKTKPQINNVKHKSVDKSATKGTKDAINQETLSALTNNNVDKPSFLDELDLVRNKDYRFTDFESLKKEPEFTVVGKKKKKVPVKEPVNNREILQKPVKREEYRKVQRSVTPPPFNKLASNIEGERTRDLSPSAFPALSSSTQSGFRDARRNSTGDVRTEVQSIIKAQDDSDIESVKSLPASSQGVWGQNSLSPRLPVSYAKMAASPKPSVTSLGSSMTEDDNGEASVDLKATKWKGQIKERRHSIGSHPENVKDCDSLKQKYGSQEVLTANVSENEIILLDSEFPKVGLDRKHDTESNSVGIEDNLTSLSNHRNNTSIVSHGSSAPKDADSAHSQSPPSVWKSTNNTEPAKQANHEESENLVDVDKCSVASDKVSNNKKTCETNVVDKGKAPKQTTNNSKKSKQSVIFMDKRVSQTPCNLGISFFFDSDNEPCAPENNSENMQKCSSSSVQNSPNIPKTSDSKKSRKSVSDNSVIDTCNSKESHPLTGKNGVVDHFPNLRTSHHPHVDNAIMFISEPNQAIDIAQISNDSSLLKQQSLSSQQNNVVLVSIGNKIEENSLPKDFQCKQLFFRQDSGDVSSNQRFNFPEAVGYLSREWERALEGSRKNPNEVKVYKE